MRKTFAFLFIGLFFGAGFGFLLAATTGAKLEGHAHGTDVTHDHNAHDHGDGQGGGEHAGMNHDTLRDAGETPPSLHLMLLPDGPQSRNLHIMASNFIFDPEAVNGAHVPGHGHAHVYVNGVKIARAYAPWFHLSALPKGDHMIRVTLNANDHSPLATGGVAIEATLPLTIE